MGRTEPVSSIGINPINCCHQFLKINLYLSIDHLSIDLSTYRSNVFCLQIEEMMTGVFPRSLDFGRQDCCWKCECLYKGQKHMKTRPENKLLSNCSLPNVALDALRSHLIFSHNNARWQVEVSLSQKWKYEPHRN